MERKYNVLVLAFPGTEEKMRRIWEHMAVDFDIEVIADPGSLQAALDEAMASDKIGREFAVVPANLVPTKPVRFSELGLAYVEVRADGSRHPWGCVPVAFDKEALVEFLPSLPEGTADDKVAEGWLDKTGMFPFEVGHGFGNFMAKSMRGNPCESRLIEAWMTRHFIYAGESGWSPVERLIDRVLEQ